MILGLDLPQRIQKEGVCQDGSGDFCSPLLPEFMVEEAAYLGLGTTVLGVPRAKRKPAFTVGGIYGVVRNTR